MQYKTFPIYVNFNDFSPEERAAALEKRKKDFYASPAAKQHAKEMAEAVRKYGSGAYDDKPRELEYLTDTIDRRKEEIKPDRGSTGQWEKEVIKHLDKIMGTQIGNLLIRSMKKTVKVWIVVDSSPAGAAASTTPGEMPAEQGGGVRLYFEPFGFLPETAERFTAADILFHELVHAYRSGWKGIKGSNWRKMAEYMTAEEFLAVHLQNIFMHEIGKKKFYLAHENNQVAHVVEVYKNIAKSRETMEVLAYYLNHEPLARIVAKWKDPLCNVWRDYGLILSHSPFKKSLPAAPRV